MGWRPWKEPVDGMEGGKAGVEEVFLRQSGLLPVRIPNRAGTPRSIFLGILSYVSTGQIELLPTFGVCAWLRGWPVTWIFRSDKTASL